MMNQFRPSPRSKGPGAACQLKSECKRRRITRCTVSRSVLVTGSSWSWCRNCLLLRRVSSPLVSSTSRTLSSAKQPTCRLLNRYRAGAGHVLPAPPTPPTQTSSRRTRRSTQNRKASSLSGLLSACRGR